MGVCNQCGNDYDLSFNVVAKDETYTFDCFECAIAKLAPKCNHCGVPIIGHGIEVDGQMYCGAHCSRAERW